MTSVKVKPLCREAFRITFSLGFIAHEVQWSRRNIGKFGAMNWTVSKSERREGLESG